MSSQRESYIADKRQFIGILRDVIDDLERSDEPGAWASTAVITVGYLSRKGTDLAMKAECLRTTEFHAAKDTPTNA